MNIFISVMMIIVYVLDLVTLKRYDNEIKKLRNENEDLRKRLGL